MRKCLIETKDIQIIKENLWHDMFWGVCICSKHKSPGQNIMGHLLMQIRRDLIKSHENSGISLYLDNQNDE